MRKLILGLLFAVGPWLCPAWATIVQYTDAATFEAAAPITTIYNFSQTPLGTYSTITFGPLSFSPANTGPQPMEVLGPPNDNTYGQRFLTFFLAANFAGLRVDISPSFVLTGFGFDFGYANTNLGSASLIPAFAGASSTKPSSHQRAALWGLLIRSISWTSIDRSYAEQAIKAGVLQLIASQFVGQTLQERAGESEMRDGINKAMAARLKSRQYWEAKYPASAKLRKPRQPAPPRPRSKQTKE
jgi:hypothetical protein